MVEFEIQSFEDQTISSTVDVCYLCQYAYGFPSLTLRVTISRSHSRNSDIHIDKGAPGVTLKLIIAIVRPSKLDDVKRELNQIEVVRLTVLPCQGFGRTRGAVPGDVAASRSRGGELNLLPKMQLQIAVNDEFVEPTIAAIQAAGRSDDDGEPGDGKIFILPMDDCIRIRTGQRGSEAI